MRRLLFSKGFFGLLMVVLLLDMVADVAEHLHPQQYELLNHVSMLFDAVGFVLVLWMFIDLSRRRPTNGDHTHSGR